MLDASDGALGPNATEADMATMDAGAIHPLTGPIFVVVSAFLPEAIFQG